MLKDVRSGDIIELETPTRTNTFVVEQIVLVYLDDVSVPHPRSVSSLTLVTCYPFYYVGSATSFRPRPPIPTCLTEASMSKRALNAGTQGQNRAHDEVISTQ